MPPLGHQIYSFVILSLDVTQIIVRIVNPTRDFIDSDRITIYLKVGPFIITVQKTII